MTLASLHHLFHLSSPLEQILQCVEKKNPTNLQFVWIISDCLHVNLAQLWRTDEALSILPGLLYTYHLIHLAPVSLLQSGFWFGWFCVDSHKEDSNMSFQAYLLSALWKNQGKAIEAMNFKQSINGFVFLVFSELIANLWYRNNRLAEVKTKQTTLNVFHLCMTAKQKWQDFLFIYLFLNKSHIKTRQKAIGHSSTKK